jgi:hypothetical protein
MSLDWSVIQESLVRHFTSSERLASIHTITKFPNFFEAWFTAECLSALIRGFPEATLLTNENYLAFSKPDIVFLQHEFVCVIEAKHLTPLSRECRGRWNGAKGSTLAKDLCALYQKGSSAVKRVLVFYGPAKEIAHPTGETCRQNRSGCLRCSIDDLREAVMNDCDLNLIEPDYIKLISTGNADFGLLVFST